MQLYMHKKQIHVYTQAHAYGLIYMCDLPPPISLPATISFSCQLFKRDTESCAPEE